MTWTVILLEEVEDWYLGLPARSRELVAGTLDQLEARGPVLPRPLSDKINGSTIHNLKELRPGSEGSSELRILYCFDPERQAVLLSPETSPGIGRVGTTSAFRLRKSDTSGG